uniref:Reverse transcriptase domain-containing protein n=1 Tax=Cyprinus carpio TaxID=7962 RepID=A0A8C2BXZ1_CYPCA
MIKLEKVLIIGDFNLHIDDMSCIAATGLLSITDSFNFTQHVSGPTHLKGHTLDLVFSLGLEIVNVCVEDVHVSDHSCVFFNLNFPRDPPPLRIKAQRRVINQDVAGKFATLFNPCQLRGCSDVNVYAESFNSQCLAILDEVAPMKSNTVSIKKPCPWINASIQSYRSKRRKIEHLWKTTKLEVHRLYLRELTTSLNELLKSARTNYFSQLISSNKKNSKFLFDTINSIVSPSVSPTAVLSLPKSNVFLDFFVEKMKDIRASIIPHPAHKACTFALSHPCFSFKLVTLHDVTTLLDKLKPSYGHSDVLPPSLFKQVFGSIGPCVVEMINTSLLTGVVPDFFKHAIVEPVLKKPSLDPLKPINYRPISKLPFMAKILEKVVAEQLNTFLEINDIFDKYQSGFRKKHSMETALVKVSSDILMSADSGKHTVLVLLDLTSAFDTIDHNIMLDKLQDLLGISGSVLKWFSSYLTGRSFSVFINQIMSDTVGLSSGVPQGSVLGPILFLLYILPLGQIISQFQDVSYHLYADDIQLYCSFKPTELYKLSSLINCLSKIKKWLNDNFLILNSAKTETLIIAPEQSIPQIKQHIGALGSSVQPSLRSLGVVFDAAMSLEKHSKQLIKNCFFQLRNISKIRALVSKVELEMIIHAFISSRLDYCNSLFICLNRKDLCRLQTVQNSAARLLTHRSKRAHITPILASLHWLPVKFRMHFKILVLTFRALQGQAPPYISDLIQLRTSSHSLRSTGQRFLVAPHTHFKTRGDRSFQVVAPRLWNALPPSIRCLDCVENFKTQLKTLLFKEAFN